MAFIYDLTDTWNAGGTTFNAIKMNVTDTASAAASKLLTLQVGGAERFGVDKAGIGTFASVVRAAGGSTSAPAFSFSSDTNTGMWSPAADTLAFSTAGSERVRVDSSGNVGIGTSSPAERLSVVSTDTYQFSFKNGSASSTGAIGYSSADNMLFYGNGSERMRITSSGNVGIGTSSPIARLDVVGAADTYARINDGTVNLVLQSYATGSSAIVGTTTNHALTLWANSAERMRIDSSGNLLVGTTSNPDSSRLVVTGGSFTHASTQFNTRPGTSTQYEFVNRNGAGFDFYVNNASNLAARIDGSGNLLVGKTADVLSNVGHFIGAGGSYTATRNDAPVGYLNRLASDGEILTFWRSTVQVGNISVTTTATAYNTSSDYRLKDIDGPIANSGAYIDALKPVQGSWKADGSRFIGLLAHEVQEVSETQIATGDKDGEEMQTMDYSAPEIIANLIAEIQSLRARVAQLEGN